MVPDLARRLALLGALPLLACGDAAATPADSDDSATTGNVDTTGTTGNVGTTGPSTSTSTPPTGDPPTGSTTAPPDPTGTTGTTATTDTGGTTGDPDVAPPVPTGWVKRWPPPFTLMCDPDYPIGVRLHQGFLYVGTNCGEVFRSADAGVTWAAKPTPVVPKMPLMMGLSGPQIWDFAADGDVLYAGIRSAGVFRTLDGGATWDDYGAGLAGFGPRQVLDLHRVGDTLYIATFGGGVLATGLDVADFKPVNTETADPNKHSPSSVCPNTPGYLDPVTMQPMTFLHGFSLTDDGTYLFYGNKCGGVYRTLLADLPGNSSWEGHGAGLPFYDAYYQDPFSLTTDGAHLYVGIDDEGAYRTPLGQDAAWEWITQAGLIYDKLDPISWTVAADSLYMGARFGGVYRSTTGDSPWTNVNTLPGGNLGNGADTIFGLAHDAAHVYAAADTGLWVSL